MTVYEYGEPSAPAVLIQPIDERDKDTIGREAALIRDLTGEPFRLIAVRVNDWNRDLSPWRAPAVFGVEDFGGGAGQTLIEALSFCTDNEKTYYIGGYSLAGLFALWVAYQTDRFAGVAAASPSVWFPGFVEYGKSRVIRTETVYLSLGDREERTRNPVMATVGENLRRLYDQLRAQGTDCTLAWNPGNHFQDADLRTAKAFAWVMARRRRNGNG